MVPSPAHDSDLNPPFGASISVASRVPLLFIARTHVLSFAGEREYGEAGRMTVLYIYIYIFVGGAGEMRYTYVRCTYVRYTYVRCTYVLYAYVSIH